MKYPWLNLIGYEFEGGWKEDESPCDLYSADELGTMGQDYSINSHRLENAGAYTIGEFNTKPVPFEKIKGVINKACPHFVHRSCGLHIHLSLKEAEYYSRLCDPEFCSFLRDESVNWALKYFKEGSHQVLRLKWGCSDYAKLDAPIYEELCSAENGDRYRQVNVLSFHEHKTIEFRLHPAYNDPRLVYEATELLLDCIDIYLEYSKPKHYESVQINLNSPESEVVDTKLDIRSKTDYVIGSDVSIFIGEIK